MKASITKLNVLDDAFYYYTYQVRDENNQFIGGFDDLEIAKELLIFLDIEEYDYIENKY